MRNAVERSGAVHAEVSDIEALLVSKRAVRIEAAKTELARPATRSLRTLVCVAPMLVAAIVGEPLAHYYGVSMQLFMLLLVLFGGVILSMAQIVSLQRKVNALTELVSAQGERENAA